MNCADADTDTAKPTVVAASHVALAAGNALINIWLATRNERIRDPRGRRERRPANPKRYKKYVAEIQILINIFFNYKYIYICIFVKTGMAGYIKINY